MRLNVHCHVREMVLNAFKSEIFAIAPVEGTERPADLAACLKILTSTFLKTLTPKQMLQRLPVALAQVKAGNIYQNLSRQYISKLTKRNLSNCIFFVSRIWNY